MVKRANTYKKGKSDGFGPCLVEIICRGEWASHNQGPLGNFDSKDEAIEGIGKFLASQHREMRGCFTFLVSALVDGLGDVHYYIDAEEAMRRSMYFSEIAKRRGRLRKPSYMRSKLARKPGHVYLCGFKEAHIVRGRPRLGRRIGIFISPPSSYGRDLDAWESNAYPVFVYKDDPRHAETHDVYARIVRHCVAVEGVDVSNDSGDDDVFDDRAVLEVRASAILGCIGEELGRRLYINAEIEGEILLKEAECDVTRKAGARP